MASETNIFEQERQISHFVLGGGGIIQTWKAIWRLDHRTIIPLSPEKHRTSKCSREDIWDSSFVNLISKITRMQVVAQLYKKISTTRCRPFLQSSQTYLIIRMQLRKKIFQKVARPQEHIYK